MTPDNALRRAPAGARFVARPTGVLHVHTGRLTPSGRFVPRSARTVCRAHTGQLHVVAPDDLQPPRRVCARCSACLSRPGRRGKQADSLLTRDDYAAWYADLEPFDVYRAAEAAATIEDLDQVAHLSLVVLGYRACTRPVVTPTGEQLDTDLNAHIGHHRHRVQGYPIDRNQERFNLAVVQAGERRKAERHAIREDREERIRRIGINNVKPHPTTSKGAPTP